MKLQKLLSLFYWIGLMPALTLGIYKFPNFLDAELSAKDMKIASRLTKDDAIKFVNLGIESAKSLENLENNLIGAGLTVQNGSLSHASYLETLPNAEAKMEDKLATALLESSLYLLNSYCLPNGISGKDCARIFSKTALPEDASLRQQCMQRYSTHHSAFRRLLPPTYRDGFYKMTTHSSMPTPRNVSKTVLDYDNKKNSIRTDEEAERNLIAVQWAQFIEHDLSKPVVKSMGNGKPIECCDKDYYTLAPRHIHPACAALEGATKTKYGFVPCLNYVRSSLAVDSRCRFGHADQLNQVTGGLDLSQLYGLHDFEAKMRSYSDGKLKTSSPKAVKLPLLPIADNSMDFCVDSVNCFMAGDSRVNCNPFATMIYTVFLRSHNVIASKLRGKYPNWSDEQIFGEAKNINIASYREMIYNEWLPTVLGEKIADEIKQDQTENINQFGTSNEFGVAAIRFYFSMMPNNLYERNKVYAQKLEQTHIIDARLGSDDPVKLLTIKENFYSSDLFKSNPKKMNAAFTAMLNQKAKKMDAIYSESMSSNYLHTKSSAKKISGLDSLAWDIQRSRDHGLQPYVKYLEKCENVRITSWSDLAAYIDREDIKRLQIVYKKFERIDLIVGGISERPQRDSAVGPTFTCILAEQFWNTRQFSMQTKNAGIRARLVDESNMNLVTHSAAKLLCETTALKSVPMNVFRIPSESNPMIRCSQLEDI